MKTTLKILRILSRHTWWWTFGLIILLAVLLTLARLLLPQLDRYRGDIEMELSNALGQPVSIAEFDVGWHGLGPRLFLHEVRLLDRSGEQLMFGFDEAHVDISVPHSLYSGQVELGELTIVGVDLSIVRQADGSYTFEGFRLPEGSEVSDDGSQAALAWLLRQKHLAIEDSVVRWSDLATEGNAFVFRQVNVHLHNAGDSHRLGGSIQLPAAIGNELEIIIEAKGKVKSMDQWQIGAYARGSELQLTQWLADKPALGVRVINGAADAELWTSWTAGKLQDLKGDLRFKDLYLFGSEQPEALADGLYIVPEMSGRFVWQGDQDNWTLDVDKFRLVQEAGEWTPTRINIRHHMKENVRELYMATNFARIQDVVDVVLASSMTSGETRKYLTGLQPRGDLHETYLKLRLSPEEPIKYFLQARVEDFGVNPWDKLPGISGVGMRLNLDQTSGVADIRTYSALLDGQKMFREPLPLNTVSGHIAWALGDDGWRTELRQLEVSNSDLGLVLDGQLDLPADGQSPVIKLLVDVKRGQLLATSRYLPVGIMSEKTVAWLDRGLVSGRIVSGAVMLHGPVKQFPFEKPVGRFEVELNVVDGIVDYTEGWPRLEQIEAEVAFVNNAMLVQGHSAKILSSDVGKVSVEIPNLREKPPQLKLLGEAWGTTAGVAHFLNESPLGERFGNITQGVQAKGLSRVSLLLKIPLQTGAAIETHGRVTFDKSELVLPRLGVDLTGLQGEVGFTEKGLIAKNVVADVMGQPAKFSIRTDELPQDKTNIVFEASGETRLDELAQRISLPVFQYLKGEAPWRAKLEIPRSKLGDDVRPVLHVMTQLKGVEVKLPSVLAKSARSERQLDLFADFKSEGAVWHFDYGRDVLSGIFELAKRNGESRLSRAELHFGAVAELPEKEGMRITGKLDYFDADDWWPVIFADKKDEHDEPPLVNQVDMKFNNAELFRQSFSNVSVNANRLPDGWSVDVQSKELAGRIKYPDDWVNPVEMTLDHLHLSLPNEGDGDEGVLEPLDFPSLRVTSKETSYDGADFGTMELTTSRHSSGFSIDSLVARSGVADINMQGAWILTNEKNHISVLNAQLNIHDLGGLLGGFGYSKSVKDGEGSGLMSLKWTTPLFDPDVSTLEGVVSLDVKDGRLLEVDPGAGRLFGLLSIQALPRRLTLDFSDLFGKGLAFDKMRGQFELKDGQAMTRNFMLDGPTASVDVAGRVGLVDEDYDQQVKVVPHVTSSLPLVGAVVGGGVGVGAAVLLAEKLFKPEIDKAAEIHYHVSGSWDKPVVKRLDD